MNAQHVRNFCIIAHIDHGKSTLADRLMQQTGAVDEREMVEQLLDSMDLERERGITIKAQAVRLAYKGADGQDYQLNLIDTPGHVDFSYEVSRSLAACEGALLVVDASQGIQAQTLANVYLALENDLEIIPVINKIDLDVAEPERVAQEVQQAFGFTDDEIVFVSAKDGTGIPEILEAIVQRVPPPTGSPDSPLRALIFDSKYDPYKGAIAYVRIMDGQVPSGSRVKIMSNGSESDVLEVGVFAPAPTSIERLSVGEVGYIATGLKSVGDAPVGDTVTLANPAAAEPLKGYQPLKPMVFAGLYPADGEDYLDMRVALEKLQLNDAALSFEPENSVALGSGFRCGFLGLLHMDIVQERLEREYDLNLLATSPSVAYEVLMTDGEILQIDSPAHLPDSSRIDEIQEPWLDLSIIAPANYIGPVIELVRTRRGEYKRMEYLQQEGTHSTPRVLMEFNVPLAEVLIDFYDNLKASTQGYASMDYSLSGYRSGRLAKVDILVNNEPVDALSIITHRDNAYYQGRELVKKLRELIPRQLFEVPVQAAIGRKIIARETIRALRKDVLAKCYGGDVTRKRKLLQKQAEGKKRMKRVGSVEIPQEAFLSILKVSR
ncbi:Elongation factor 4 [Geodia barretti]|uniref:Translation factor GUF1 homolog, mitochondrial n=1 Tax=Geodia barretti TaxID=519541 RepID=A0AA35W0C2_GEOBA|nr:Elongation factor 4 [Geodia barretti]